MHLEKKPLSISSILEKIPHRAAMLPFREDKICYLSTDSRSLLYPKETLFIALVTATGDGHRYIPELVDRGVRNFLISQPIALWEAYQTKCNFIEVSDSLEGMQHLAHEVARRDAHRIAITGSRGKTITKELLYQILSSHTTEEVYRSPYSYNSQIGVALSLFDSYGNYQIYEAGISQRGEMQRLEEILQPEIGILTSITEEHQSGFLNIEEKIREKLILFQDCRWLVLGSNTPRAKRLWEGSHSSHRHTKLLYWTKEEEEADIRYELLERRKTSTLVRIYDYFSPQGKRSAQPSISLVELPFTQEYDLDNLFAALSAARLILPDSLQTLAQTPLSKVRMRLDLRSGFQGNSIIEDHYDFDLRSLAHALDFLYRRSRVTSAKKVVILDALPEEIYGDKSSWDTLNYLVESYQIDRLILIGSHKYALSERAISYPDIEALLKSNILDKLRHSLILIKSGKETTALDRLQRKLLDRQHQTRLEVNLNALVDNYQHYRKKLAREHKIVAMIKADAYGLGALEVARSLEDLGVSFLAVALSDEGQSLRRFGIHARIMVMNPEPASFGLLFDYDLEPEVYSLELLKELIQAAHSRGIKNYPIHIKIDSGMHRLGFSPLELDPLLELLSQQDSLRVSSIFSHLSASDDAGEDTFTQKQIETFDQLSRKLQNHLRYPTLRHILNTAGIERWGKDPLASFDMVRLGIGLYGYDPTGGDEVKAVAKLKTTILQIRELPEGENLGYGHKFFTERPTRVGIIPIGYADGLRRSLSGGRYAVEVAGKSAPILGNICMDTTLIDLTDIPEAEAGEEVIIFGGKLSSIETLAKAVDTIPYEILTSISSRVVRTYFRDDLAE